MEFLESQKLSVYIFAGMKDLNSANLIVQYQNSATTHGVTLKQCSINKCNMKRVQNQVVVQ